MKKTRKVQVTLDASQYEAVARVAEQEGKGLAAVVRESIVRYCVGPESEKAKREALRKLFSLSAPPPEDYGVWEREYSELKAEARWTRGKPASSTPTS